MADLTSSKVVDYLINALKLPDQITKERKVWFNSKFYLRPEPQRLIN
jgi:hypothetical protein